MKLTKTNMIIGIVAIGAIAYYFYSKNKKTVIPFSKNGLKINTNSAASESVDTGSNKGADGRNLTVHK